MSTVTDLVSLARTNTKKHYGDVLAEEYIIETERGIEGIRSELVERGLAGQPGNFRFRIFILGTGRQSLQDSSLETNCATSPRPTYTDLTLEPITVASP